MQGTSAGKLRSTCQQAPAGHSRQILLHAQFRNGVVDHAFEFEISQQTDVRATGAVSCRHLPQSLVMSINLHSNMQQCMELPTFSDPQLTDLLEMCLKGRLQITDQ